MVSAWLKCSNTSLKTSTATFKLRLRLELKKIKLKLMIKLKNYNRKNTAFYLLVRVYTNL